MKIKTLIVSLLITTSINAAQSNFPSGEEVACESMLGASGKVIQDYDINETNPRYKEQIQNIIMVCEKSPKHQGLVKTLRALIK